ncbi:sulfotransferase 1B1-like isoform X1 [Crassostrea virginica]
MPEMNLRSDKRDDESHLRVLKVDGYYLPPFVKEEHFRSMKTWKARNDDVIISAYPKAGTHWLWEVVSMLIQKKAERIPEIKETAMIEGLTEEKFHSLATPRVINTHVYFQHLPKDLFAKRCKIVYILRNPKDIAVSYYNHHKKLLMYEFDGPWDNYFQRFMQGNVDYGSWFDYTLEMERFIEKNPDYPIHVMYYEDLKENGTKEITKLAAFLEIDVGDDFVRSVNSLCQFDKMQQEKNKNETASMWRDKIHGMYRKGEVGDWKNWFTVAQNEMFDSIYQQKMANTKSKLRFSL